MLNEIKADDTLVKINEFTRERTTKNFIYDGERIY